LASQRQIEGRHGGPVLGLAERAVPWFIVHVDRNVHCADGIVGLYYQ
jgi:hypothetical protein